MQQSESMADRGQVASQIQGVRESLVSLDGSLHELQDAMLSASVNAAVASPMLLAEVAETVGGMVALAERLRSIKMRSVST
jgi:hypothetical protein